MYMYIYSETLFVTWCKILAYYEQERQGMGIMYNSSAHSASSLYRFLHRNIVEGTKLDVLSNFMDVCLYLAYWIEQN